MEAYDIRAALIGLPELAITPSMSEEDAARSMQFIWRVIPTAGPSILERRPQ